MVVHITFGEVDLKSISTAMFKPKTLHIRSFTPEYFQVVWTLLIAKQARVLVAVHLGVKMADTLSFTAKVDMVDF